MKYIKLFENFDESDLKEIELEIGDIFVELVDDGLTVSVNSTEWKSIIDSDCVNQKIRLDINKYSREPEFGLSQSTAFFIIKNEYLDSFNHFFSYIEELGFYYHFKVKKKINDRGSSISLDLSKSQFLSHKCVGIAEYFNIEITLTRKVKL